MTEVGLNAEALAGQVRRLDEAERTATRIAPSRKPGFGLLLDSMLLDNGREAPLVRFIQPRAEVELAFVMKHRRVGPVPSAARGGGPVPRASIDVPQWGNRGLGRIGCGDGLPAARAAGAGALIARTRPRCWRAAQPA